MSGMINLKLSDLGEYLLLVDVILKIKLTDTD